MINKKTQLGSDNYNTLLVLVVATETLYTIQLRNKIQTVYMRQKLYINAPAHYILVLIALLSNEVTGEPAQMRRHTRAFAARIHKVMMLM